MLLVHLHVRVINTETLASSAPESSLKETSLHTHGILPDVLSPSSQVYSLNLAVEFL